jgi:hypothetical protein
MNIRRELISGLLAALVTITVIYGSFAISFAEGKPEISQAISTTAITNPSPANPNYPESYILVPVPTGLDGDHRQPG